MDRLIIGTFQVLTHMHMHKMYILIYDLICDLIFLSFCLRLFLFFCSLYDTPDRSPRLEKRE